MCFKLADKSVVSSVSTKFGGICESHTMTAGPIGLFHSMTLNELRSGQRPLACHSL